MAATRRLPTVVTDDIENRCPVGEITYRPFEPADVDRIRQLNESWFPVTYGARFYDGLVAGQLPDSLQPFFSSLAILQCPGPRQCPCCRSHATQSPPRADRLWPPPATTSATMQGVRAEGTRNRIPHHRPTGRAAARAATAPTAPTPAAGAVVVAPSGATSGATSTAVKQGRRTLNTPHSPPAASGSHSSTPSNPTSTSTCTSTTNYTSRPSAGLAPPLPSVPLLAGHASTNPAVPAPPSSWSATASAAGADAAHAATTPRHREHIVGAVFAQLMAPRPQNRVQLLDPSCGSPSSTQLLYILTLGVVPSFRRRGIAKQLVRQVCDVAARTHACKAVYLHVLWTNEGARKLYASCGFRHLIHLQNFYVIRGVSDHADLFVMYVNGGKPPKRVLQWTWCSPALTATALLVGLVTVASLWVLWRTSSRR